jgi:PAS domain S-box-containing protein
MEANRIKLLLIEDNLGDARLIREALREAGGERFDLQHADRLATGFARLDEGGFQLVLLDLSLPDSHGLDTVARTHAQAPDVPIVVLTGLDDEALALKALETGAQDYLVKGDLDGRALSRAIRYAIERQRGEQALRQSEARFRGLLDSAPDAILIVSREGRITFANAQVEKTFGYRPEELLGQTIEMLMPDRFREQHGQHRFGYLAAPRARPMDSGLELRGKRKDGGEFDADILLGPLEREGDLSVLCIVRDITERKQAEAALQKAHDELEFKVQERTAALSQANALLQTMMDYIPDQIYFKDAQSRFIRNSRSQADLMGLSDPAEVVGKTDFDFFPHAQRSYEEEQELMRSGQPLIDLEEYVVWPDGRATWISTTKAPLRDKEGQIIGTFGISRDITERKRAEQAIQQLNADLQKKAAQLEAANKELEAFSYSVSHDLRAPLRGIDGWSLALLEDYHDALDEQGRQYLDRVRSETQRMGQLIDDMLQLARVTRAEMHKAPVNLSALAQTIAAHLQETEPGRPVAFNIQLGLSAQGDASLLEVALSNLLSNAFKFTGKTPQARIEFGQTEIQGERAFFVRDNGAGFDMAYAQRLFGAFQRLHKTSEFPGTGIGLATVQRVIHRHGGRVWAEAGVNQGATFYFTLEAAG